MSFNLNGTYVHYNSIYSTELHVTPDSIQSNLLGAHWWNFAGEDFYSLFPANKYLNKYKFEEWFSGILRCEV